MSDLDVVRHTAEDGSVYAVEVVPPERDGYGAQYGVDLVRASTDRYGLEHEQRLRLGAYASWGAAEEHQREVETALEKDGLEGLGEDARRVAQMPYLDGQYLALVFPTDGSAGETAKVHLLYLSGEQVTAALIADGRTEDMETLCGQLDRAWAEGGNERLLDTAQREAEARGQVAPGLPLFDAVPTRVLSDDLPFTFGDGMQPYDAQGIGQAYFVDGGGAAHWFAAVENKEPEAEPYELRYFRALAMNDGTLKHDSYPVMPLPDDDPASAWPLPGLEMYLEKGDLYMAQQFAHDVADHYGQDFPDPFDLPALNAQPDYYFGYGTGPNNLPSLEAVKTWMDGSERRFDTFTIAEYADYGGLLARDEDQFNNLLEGDGLEAAMNEAEKRAVENGYLDPKRTDTRVFFANDAPSDPFTTIREREMRNDVKYSFDYNLFGDDALALEAHKAWREPDGTERSDFILLDLHEGDSGGQAVERFEAEVERLTTMQQSEGLEAAMREAEKLAVANGLLDGERADPRLFTQGPPDPFTTLRERELMASPGVSSDPQYQVDAISANGASRLDVLKSWGDAEHERERLLIPQPDWDTAQANAQAAYDMLLENNLQGAMTLVELAGMEAGVIDPQRADPHLFTQGPPDPFTTIRERELTQTVDVTELDTEPYTPVTLEAEAPDYPTMYREFAAEAARQREANASLEGAAWFDATFKDSERGLLESDDDSVRYAVVVQEADPWTLELAVEKYWREPNGYLGTQSVTLNTYDPDTGREQAEQERDALLEVREQHGLEAMMHKAELAAMHHDWLDGDRADPRLFTQGPPDRFETLAQRLEGEINPYWNISGEQIEEPAPQQEVDNPYWRLDTLLVKEPDGEPLGHALHMVVYPGVERDPEAVGSPAMAEDEPFRMLEMAHFETPEAVDEFGREFNSYLVPGLLDGPELAVEVARLEGLPAEWKTLEGDDLKAYQKAELTLTRDPADWHPYNPNAERDARIAAEGLYTDPLHQAVERDEPEIASSTPELDF
jgi:hypothetical protein